MLKISRWKSGKVIFTRENCSGFSVRPDHCLVEMSSERFTKRKERGKIRALSAVEGETFRLFFFVDDELHIRADFAEQLDWNLIFADQLDGIGQRNLALLDRIALRRKSLGNVAGGYGPE